MQRKCRRQRQRRTEHRATVVTETRKHQKHESARRHDGAPRHTPGSIPTIDPQAPSEHDRKTVKRPKKSSSRPSQRRRLLHLLSVREWLREEVDKSLNAPVVQEKRGQPQNGER